jgi:hypothetical protein
VTHPPAIIFRKAIVTYLVMASLLLITAESRPNFHYTFVLPDGYVGWIQIIFGDREAGQLPHRQDGGYAIEVPESGIVRTSHLRIHDMKRKDEFYYLSTLSPGHDKLLHVPTQNVLPGDDHGGFGVMDTGGKGSGYSWFIFIGPPQIRAKEPLGDSAKEIAAHTSPDGHFTRMMAPDVYPTPGRMRQDK